jgi:hypothetical protein
MKQRFLVLALAALAGTDAALAAPAIVVTARSGEAGAPETYVDGSADRGKHALAVDADGNTYVVGSRRVGSQWRIVTTKYRRDGTVAWHAMQPADAPNPGQFPYGVGVDAAGNVYVTGTNYVEFVTLKYDADGQAVWDRRWSMPFGNGGLYQQPRAMAVDAAGNVYVAGRSQSGGSGIDDFDYGLVKYDTDGNLAWSARYDGPEGLNDEVEAIAIDADGAAYLTGTSKRSGNRTEYATVKFDALGVQQWATHFGNGLFGDGAHAIVVNGDSVVVTGATNYNGNYDAGTVAYDRATGTQQWTARYAGLGFGGGADAGWAITRDTAGNVYVAGSTWDQQNGFLTIKYDANGVQQWTRNWQPYTGISGSNLALSIAADPDGGVVAVGPAIHFNGFNYGVVKYDAAGTLAWSQHFDSPANGNDQPGAVVVRDDGIVVVAGTEALAQNNGDTSRRTTLFIADGVQGTTTTVTTEPAVTVTGEPYKVRVSTRGKVGLPVGGVSVSDEASRYCNIWGMPGDGECTMQSPVAGTRTIRAAFYSDQRPLFGDSEATITHVVNKAATDIILTAPSLSRPGQAFTATVFYNARSPGRGIPSGAVIVTDGIDYCTVQIPAYQCSLTLTTAGVRKVMAAHAGDDNYLPGVVYVSHRVNRLPVAASDVATVNEDVTLSVDAATGLLANDTDPDGDTLSVVAGTFTADGIGGTLTVRADGSYDYAPPPNANGIATYTYTLGDGAETATGDLTITVLPVNDPPTFGVSDLHHGPATSGVRTVPGFAYGSSAGPPDEAGQTITEYLLTLDQDNSDILTSASIDAQGNLVYVLTGHGGVASFTLRARDDGGTANGGIDLSAGRPFQIRVASGIDLIANISNDRDFLTGGATATWIATFANAGPDLAEGVNVGVPQRPNLTSYAWTCVRDDAVPCPAASGNGRIAQAFDLPAGVTVRYTITATVIADPESPVTINMTSYFTGSHIDLQPANNNASDTDTVGLFADGFDD